MLLKPHAPLLTELDRKQLLYKVIPSQYFFKMLEGNYLHFRRADKYEDANGNDLKDSDLTDSDKKLSNQVFFDKSPDYSLGDYYNACREKTYVCCFSTENTDHIWKEYGGCDSNAVCVVFERGVLTDYLDTIYADSKLFINGINCKNFISLNYGIINYGNIKNDSLADAHFQNPIKNTHFKDSQYREDNEFRISLSHMHPSKKYALPDGKEFTFPEELFFPFDWKNVKIKELLVSQTHEDGFLETLKQKLLLNKIEMVLN